ncbi:hypothetical protein b4026 [Escherichia coli K-12]|nr:hypothetical protein b4026 [Escherichia coli K-12]
MAFLPYLRLRRLLRGLHLYRWAKRQGRQQRRFRRGVPPRPASAP